MKKGLILALALLSQFSYAQVFDVDTILWSGASNNRINLVILGDGYQSSELSKFSTDAQAFTNKLFSQTPYKEYKNYFNVVIIKVPSNASGASHPGAATDVTEPSHPVSIVDNYFGSTFDAYNIHRLLVATKTAAIANVLASNFPSYDQTLILVNSPYYGGSGGKYPTASLATSSDEIAIHELGHSFASLADEYYAGDGYAAEKTNMTKETNPNKVKWKNWMNQNGIGIYRHCCGGNATSWYRPHQACKMMSLGSHFCSVCIETTIERIHSLVNVVDSYLPPNLSTLNLAVPMTFSINTINPIPNTLNSVWKLNGTVINNATDSVLVSQNDLTKSNNQLQVTVEDTTSFQKIDNHQSVHISSVIWNINFITSGFNKISTHILKIDLFPNPTQDFLYWNLTNETNEDYDIIVSDRSGNSIITNKFKSSELHPKISLQSLPTGVYIITFNFKSGVNVSSKIIKE